MKNPFARESHKSARRRAVYFSLVSCLLAAGFWVLVAREDSAPLKSRFTMARIRYAVPPFSFWGPVGAGNGPPWSHDFPRSEAHFMKIMSEVTKLDVNPEGKLVTFEDDEVFKYPIVYLCEVGYIDLSEREAQNMREYCLRGGFIIVDDFRGERALANFKQQMKFVFPDRSLEELPRSHQIWTCFYDISKLFPVPPYGQFNVPQYLGMSDDKGRLMMVVDYNNDISEYWEWSDDPFRPIEQTNEAYKYGVNYVMYALTH